MDEEITVPIRILLFKLRDEVLCDLRDALISARLVPAIEEFGPAEVVEWDQYDLVFCPVSDDVLHQVVAAATGKMAKVRVIAVSRLPDVQEWLDAVEDGALDYFAPPFEQSQVRSLIQAHFPGGRGSYLAAPVGS